MRIMIHGAIRQQMGPAPYYISYIPRVLAIKEGKCAI